eukprot:s3266_g4.t1
MAHVRRWYLLALLALWDFAGLCRDGVSFAVPAPTLSCSRQLTGRPLLQRTTRRLDEGGVFSNVKPIVSETLKQPGLWLATGAVIISGMSGGDLPAAVGVALCAAIGAWFGKRTPLGRALTGPVSAMALGVLVASQHAVPGAVLRRLQFTAVTMATPLLLLSCNIKEVMGQSTRRLLMAFLVGAASTVFASGLAAALFRGPLATACGGWEHAATAIAALAAKNIGSGMNFVVVAQALCMKPLIMAASLAVDSALGVVYFPLAASLTPSNEDLEEFGVFSGDDTMTKTHSLADYAITLSVALVVAVISEIICPEGYACILSSAVAVALAAIPGAQERFASGEALGWPLLYIYFASAGFTVGAVEFLTLIKFSPLIDFGIALYGLHLCVLLAAGRFLGLSRPELLVASSANIGGPATASSLASAKGWDQLKRPALLVGTFGNATASGLGILLFRILSRLS